MVISKDFKEFIESLNARKVRYLIVGGYAVAFHGHPRYTKSLDIWIDPDEKNLSRLVSALDGFGFSSLGLNKEDFRDPETVVQLGYPPNRIDILTALKGVKFEECYGRRRTVVIEGTTVDFIDVESLRVTKAATGRHQDLADVENLK